MTTDSNPKKKPSESAKERREAIALFMRNSGTKYSSLEKIVNALSNDKIYVSKATLGRDLGKIGYIKEGTRYVFDPEHGKNKKDEGKRKIREKFLTTHISYIQHPVNLVALKTTLETSSAVAYRLKKLFPERILGTLSDNNMVLVFLNTGEDATAFIEQDLPNI